MSEENPERKELNQAKQVASWSSEKIISYSAILISLMSLVALMYQTSIMREEQQLQRKAQLKSTMPYMMIANSNYGGPNYAIIISNKGVGPALIDSTVIMYKDSAYLMDLPTFLYEQIPGLREVDHLYHSNITPGQLISPGETIEIIRIDNSQESADQFLKALAPIDLNFRLIYRSVYDERWVLSSDSYYPVKIEE
ncbi:MAG: hypothetical protein KI786_02090 [Mameliella sp.]|nr:hypothetical protein [Phaeodactylibacter sp.]